MTAAHDDGPRLAVHAQLNPTDRLGVQSDVFAMARCCRSPTSAYLALLSKAYTTSAVVNYRTVAADVRERVGNWGSRGDKERWGVGQRGTKEEDTNSITQHKSFR